MGIISESRTLMSTLADLDNVRGRLIASDGAVTVASPAPFVAGFEKWRHCLLERADIKPLPRKQWMRPDYTSNEEYGTTIYWAMLLYINNLPSLESYTVPKILVPRQEAVAKISSLDAADVADVRIDGAVLPPAIPKLAEFAPADTAAATDVRLLSRLGKYKTETIVLDVSCAAACKVELEGAPDKNSFSLKCPDYRRQLVAGVDYSLVKENGSWWIKWNGSDVTRGKGLASSLFSGSVLEAQYITYQ